MLFLLKIITFYLLRRENIIQMRSIIRRINVTHKNYRAAFLLLIVFSLLAEGCILGYGTQTPSDTVNSYFDAVQWLDIEGINELVAPSERLDEDEIDELRDNVSEVTGLLREWEITITNRTLTVLEQNETHASINASVDMHVSALVRNVRESNQTHFEANFDLELVDSQWLISAYMGPELLPPATA